MATLIKSKTSCLEDLTDKELLNSLKILIEDDPLKLVNKEMLHIKTKAGDMELLNLNSTQQRLFNKRSWC